MDCNSCKERQKQAEPVPYIVHEADMSRMERMNRRSHFFCIIMAVLLVLSWAGFLIYESQFEMVAETTQEVWQDSDFGVNRFIGGDFYGNAEGQDND